MSPSEDRTYKTDKIIAVKVKIRKKEQPKSRTCSDWSSNRGEISMTDGSFCLMLASNSSIRIFAQIVSNFAIDLMRPLELSGK